jgi:hypothetical protein
MSTKTVDGMRGKAFARRGIASARFISPLINSGALRRGARFQRMLVGLSLLSRGRNLCKLP